MSFDQLMGRLLDETRKQPDPDYVSSTYQSINMNSFQMALRDVLVERKETIRATLDPTMYFPPNIVYGMNDILKSNLENPDLHLTEDEKKDEEIVDMEKGYQQKVKQLKLRLEKNLGYVDEKSEKYQKKMKDVLEEQMKFRPIDQLDLNRAIATIKYSHDRIRNETKETATNSIMVMMNQINDARKRRRNFTKDATDRLQLFFENNKYPTESEKELLAMQCNITVQQVSNWFGNRRIRLKRCVSKKDQYDGAMEPMYNPDGSIAYISSHDYGMGETVGDETIASSSNNVLDVLDISNYTAGSERYHLHDDKLHLD